MNTSYLFSRQHGQKSWPQRNLEQWHNHELALQFQGLQDEFGNIFDLPVGYAIDWPAECVNHPLLSYVFNEARYWGMFFRFYRDPYHNEGQWSVVKQGQWTK